LGVNGALSTIRQYVAHKSLVKITINSEKLKRHSAYTPLRMQSRTTRQKKNTGKTHTIQETQTAKATLIPSLLTTLSQ